MRLELCGTQWTSELVPDSSLPCHETFEAVVAEGDRSRHRERRGAAPTRAHRVRGRMLGADGRLLATPTNLGYISDALKHYLGYYPSI